MQRTFFWDVSQNRANILVVNAGFVTGVGAISENFQFGSSRKVALASCFLRADAVEFCGT
jgi:hypothetical protein